jgi:two-component system response regulator FixJ
LKRIICIVEDDTAVRESLRLVLELRGYDVEEFEDGVTFLARGNFEDILCFIFDLNLPGESGLQVLAQLRSRGNNTPAFIVTGRASSLIRKEAERLQALALFEKPLPARELLAVVDGVAALH